MKLNNTSFMKTKSKKLDEQTNEYWRREKDQERECEMKEKGKLSVQMIIVLLLTLEKSV